MAAALITNVQTADRPTAGPCLTAEKDFWARHRILTLVPEFGDIGDGSNTKRGVIEAYFESLDAAPWAEAKKFFPKSKIRAAHWFAQHVACHSEVVQLYQTLVQLILGPAAPVG